MERGRMVEAVRRALRQARNEDEAVRLAVEAVHAASDRHDWTGVYLMDGPEMLVLSHFIGAPTPHARIPLGAGICGAAARERSTIIVPDVGSDPRYLACSAQTRSEIVVPIMKDGVVLGEIDIDSNTPGAFGPEDRRALEEVAVLLAGRLAARRGGAS